MKVARPKLAGCHDNPLWSIRRLDPYWASTSYRPAEKHYIGGTITLKLPNDEASVGAQYPFTLPNGLSVIYGQINA